MSTKSTSTPLPSSPLLKATGGRLLANIFSGQYPEHANLPAERELCQELGASRGTLREVLRILEGMGVVSSHRGSGVVVRPITEWGFEILPAYMEATFRRGGNVAAIVGDMLELRRELAFALFRLVGPHLSPGDLNPARTYAAEAWAARADFGEFLEASQRSWRACVEPTGNLAALWAVNTLNRVFTAVGRLTALVGRVPEGYLEAHMQAYSALEARNAEGAIAAMRPYYERHDRAVLNALKAKAKSG